MKYNDESIRQICRSVAEGNTEKDAAALAGISQKTLIVWKKTHRIFREAMEIADKKFKEVNIRLIQGHAQRSWQAAAWLLERKYDEFRIKNQTEIGGLGGGPIIFKTVTYGNSDPLQLYARDTQSTSAGGPTRPKALPSAKLAPKGEEDDAGDKPTGEMGQ